MVHVDHLVMSYTEKIDVLDMLINILREHEEKLDELVTRLEAEDLRRHGPAAEAAEDPVTLDEYLSRR
ncbi:unnamed protein product [marine sediment metagenome]|uniref:Uncharacterized protein n=1 Tax=marine sediment metagenome TaxID=412755 RepID=X1IY18_9ZZZZ